MIIAIGLHMLQVYLYGAYKPPRELMWMMGVALFILTLSFGFSGYLLPWDQKAYWATQVGINMVGTIPFVGDSLVRVIRGGRKPWSDYAESVFCVTHFVSSTCNDGSDCPASLCLEACGAGWTF